MNDCCKNRKSFSSLAQADSIAVILALLAVSQYSIFLTILVVLSPLGKFIFQFFRSRKARREEIELLRNTFSLPSPVLVRISDRKSSHVVSLVLLKMVVLAKEDVMHLRETVDDATQKRAIGSIAHEFAHLERSDFFIYSLSRTLIFTLVFFLILAVGLLSGEEMGHFASSFLWIMVMIAASLFTLIHSREHLADIDAATRHPMAVKQFLKDNGRLKNNWFSRITSFTHPSFERRLKVVLGKQGPSSWDVCIASGRAAILIYCLVAAAFGPYVRDMAIFPIVLPVQVVMYAVLMAIFVHSKDLRTIKGSFAGLFLGTSIFTYSLARSRLWYVDPANVTEIAEIAGSLSLNFCVNLAFFCYLKFVSSRGVSVIIFLLSMSLLLPVMWFFSGILLHLNFIFTLVLMVWFCFQFRTYVTTETALKKDNYVKLLVMVQIVTVITFYSSTRLLFEQDYITLSLQKKHLSAPSETPLGP